MKALMLTVVLSAAACAPQFEPAEPALGKDRAAVINGVRDPDELPFLINRLERNAVGGPLYRIGGQDSQGCSGTLVGDRVVVTAGHCIVSNVYEWIEAHGEIELRLGNPELIDYVFGDDVRAPLCRIDVAELHLHPDFAVSPSGFLTSDVAVILLAESAFEACPGVVPLQVNIDPPVEVEEGDPALQGGFGALDESYDFSPIRYWSLVEIDAFEANAFSTVDIGHGFPARGDSGSGLLYRFSDGSLRVLGVASTSDGDSMSFARTDLARRWLLEFLDDERVCGPVDAGGVCRDGYVVRCGRDGFTTEDCAASDQTCIEAPEGGAACGVLAPDAGPPDAEPVDAAPPVEPDAAGPRPEPDAGASAPDAAGSDTDVGTPAPDEAGDNGGCNLALAGHPAPIALLLLPLVGLTMARRGRGAQPWLAASRAAAGDPHDASPWSAAHPARAEVDPPLFWDRNPWQRGVPD